MNKKEFNLNTSHVKVNQRYSKKGNKWELTFKYISC